MIAYCLRCVKLAKKRPDCDEMLLATTRIGGLKVERVFARNANRWTAAGDGPILIAGAIAWCFMWQSLMDWLPDVRGGTFEIADLLNLLMTAVGAFLAFLAIRMGRAQQQIGQEQLAIAKRQEALDVELGKITKRQGEITEAQHRAMQEQMGRRAKLHLVLNAREIGPEHAEFGISIKNTGDRLSAHTFWHVSVPADSRHTVSFSPYEPKESTVLVGDTLHTQYAGYLSTPIFPDKGLTFGVLKVSHPILATGNYAVRWHLSCEDGGFPDKNNAGRIVLGSELGEYE